MVNNQLAMDSGAQKEDKSCLPQVKVVVCGQSTSSVEQLVVPYPAMI